MTRTDGLFRGAELSRLVILSVIMVTIGSQIIKRIVDIKV